MRRADKVIITCAVTGGIHTPSMSPHLPITPGEIAQQSLDAARAGAAIVHLHARHPQTGRPTQDPEVFAQFLPAIKSQTDAVINLTTGGGLGMSLVERLAPARRFRPEVASLNMGSMNFGLFQAADKRDSWRFDWEEPYLRSSYDFIYANTFKMIETTIREVGDECGTRFEFECYDVGHLYNLAYFVEQKLVQPPLFIQCVFGVLGGIGADVDNLVHMKSVADRLFGDTYYLSVLAAGKHQMRQVTASALMGGNVRVGLEDSLYIDRGRLASANAQQVTRVRQILEALGFEIATPADARAMLALKGGANTSI